MILGTIIILGILLFTCLALISSFFDKILKNNAKIHELEIKLQEAENNIRKEISQNTDALNVVAEILNGQQNFLESLVNLEFQEDGSDDENDLPIHLN